MALALGCTNVVMAFDLTPDEIAEIHDLSAVIYWGKDPQSLARACAERDGPITKLIIEPDPTIGLTLEQVICVDTTASGGNAKLLAASA